MPHLLYEKRDGIAFLTFNRPESLNALSPEMIVRLADAWRDFRDDDDLRVSILTGAGERAFCVGGDLERIPYPGDGLGKFESMGRKVFENQGTASYEARWN